MSFGEDGRTFLGNEPANAAITLCGLGVDAVGVNCSLGPEQLIPIVEEFCRYSTVPVIVQANAGLPEIKDGKTVFNITPEEYCRHIEKILELGVCILGGCCGTTPEFIKKLSESFKDNKIIDRAEKSIGTLGGGNHFIEVNKDEVLVAENYEQTKKIIEKNQYNRFKYVYVDEEETTEKYFKYFLQWKKG